MNARVLSRIGATAIIVTFMALAAFGLYVPTHVGHGAGCIFSPAEIALCSSSIAHIQHWQSAFAAVLTELLLAAGALLVVFVWNAIRTYASPQFERYRVRRRYPARPTLLQELFSRGILNRKDPDPYTVFQPIH